MNKSAVEFASPSDCNHYNYSPKNKDVDDNGKNSIINFLAHTKAIIKMAINQMQTKP